MRLRLRLIAYASLGSLLCAAVITPEAHGQQPAGAENENLDQRLASLEEVFSSALKRDALTPRHDAVDALRKSYVDGLNRALDTATRAGKLDDAVALRDEKQRIENNEAVPGETEEPKDTPETLKTLRRTFRASLARYDGSYTRAFQALADRYDQTLNGLQTQLTKAGKLDDALRVKNVRDELAKRRADGGASFLSSTKQPGAPSSVSGPATSQPPALSAAAPTVNTLGMKFVPLPGTKVQMCIHETRRKDYAAYASKNSRSDDSWKNPNEMGDPVSKDDEDPVVMVSWDDANAFCAWLSKKERRTYRLPSDREWSVAVGLGEREAPDATPLSLSEQIRDEFPWGAQWPPPQGSANLLDATFGKKFPNSKGVPVIQEYNDGFATTAPVMSFSPNKLGIYDLGGNVREWCSDWLEEAKGTRGVRGGSYRSVRGGVLSSFRSGRPPNDRSPDVGFRCVVEVP